MCTNNTVTIMQAMGKSPRLVKFVEGRTLSILLGPVENAITYATSAISVRTTLWIDVASGEKVYVETDDHNVLEEMERRDVFQRMSIELTI